MKDASMGDVITQLRKERGMTQRELAEKLHVTDKAVSKWERNLSCPDITALPCLAETLGVSVEELLQAKGSRESRGSSRVIDVVLKAVPLAMGVAVIVTAAMKTLDLYAGFSMLGIGLVCLGLAQLRESGASD